ncbi:MAG: acyltransferase [Deltaproteobacteria bacterium]|nr:acyltransferase [Deltaproteobacteria bacterium]
MKKKVIRTGGIQLAPSSDRKETVSRAVSLVGLAAEKGACIVCLPQLFSLPWFPARIDESNFSLAEPADGSTVTAMREAALKYGVVIVAPVFEKDGAVELPGQSAVFDGQLGGHADYFNTAFVIGIKGEIIGRYRKVHVPQIPLWEERTYFKAGDLGFPVFKTPFATIGVQLCWDLFFPEGMRVLALEGSEIVFAPTASAFHHSRLKWERALLAAAHSNGLFVFRVNRVGAEGAQEFYGRSFCAGPDGEYRVKPSGSSEGVVLADVDLAEIGAARNVWGFLKERRPAFYKKIAEQTGEDGWLAVEDGGLAIGDGGLAIGDGGLADEAGRRAGKTGRMK